MSRHPSAFPASKSEGLGSERRISGFSLGLAAIPGLLKNRFARKAGGYVRVNLLDDKGNLLRTQTEPIAPEGQDFSLTHRATGRETLEVLVGDGGKGSVVVDEVIAFHKAKASTRLTPILFPGESAPSERQPKTHEWCMGWYSECGCWAECGTTLPGVTVTAPVYVDGSDGSGGGMPGPSYGSGGGAQTPEGGGGAGNYIYSAAFDPEQIKTYIRYKFPCNNDLINQLRIVENIPNGENEYGRFDVVDGVPTIYLNMALINDPNIFHATLAHEMIHAMHFYNHSNIFYNDRNFFVAMTEYIANKWSENYYRSKGMNELADLRLSRWQFLRNIWFPQICQFCGGIDTAIANAGMETSFDCIK